MKEEAELRGKVGNPMTSTAENLNKLATPIPGAGALIFRADIPAQVIQELNLATEDAAVMSFARLRTLQTRLGALVAETPRGEAKRTLTRMYSALLEDFDNMADQVPGLSSQMKLANEFYKKEVVENFIKNESFHDITEKDASLLAGSLLGPKVSIEQVRRIKSAMPKQSFDRLVAGWLADMTETRSLGELGEFSVRKFLSNTSKVKYSPQVLKEILGQERAEGLNSLRRVFVAIHKSQIGGGNPSLTARAILGERQIGEAIRLGIGGVGQIATGGLLYGVGVNPVAAAIVGSLSLFSPIAIAKLVYSKKGAEFLSTGFKLGPKGASRAFETSRIPVMLGVSKVDWPFANEEQWMGEIKSNEEILTPQTPQPQDPRKGVRVEVSKNSPRSLPEGLYIPR
jgi:hypothetical protein